MSTQLDSYFYKGRKILVMAGAYNSKLFLGFPSPSFAGAHNSSYVFANMFLVPGFAPIAEELDIFEDGMDGME